MGFLKSFLKTVSPSAAHHADKEQTKKNDALAARVYDLEQQQPSALLGGGLGGAYGGMQPGQNQPQIQLPQLQMQFPQQYFGLGQGGFGQMPSIRNAAFANTLSPLMQPNYGLPFISPYGQGMQNGQQPSTPYQPQPGLPPGTQPYQPPPPGGFAQFGLQPLRGAMR